MAQYNQPSISRNSISGWLNLQRWNLWIQCCAVLSRPVVYNSKTPWIVAHQAPLPMGILQARLE